MQQMAEGPDRCGVAQNGAKATVLSIFDLTKPIAVLDDGLPTRELSDPWADVIIHADVAAENVTAPAVMVASHPKDRNVRVHEIRERGEDSKRRSRDDGLP